MDNKIKWVKRLYLYIFSAVGLILLIIGSVQIINIGLKTFIFTKADIVNVYPEQKMILANGERVSDLDIEKMTEYQINESASRRQRDASNAVAMILVGLPLFLYHWSLAKKREE